MSIDKNIQVKLDRLEELRKYQSYYGPNTPYPVIVEINDLETELQRAMNVSTTRPTSPVRRKKAKKNVPFWKVWELSQATIDTIAIIAFIGVLFLVGSVIVAFYVQSTRPNNQNSGFNRFVSGSVAEPTLRPTFTPTSAFVLPGDEVQPIEDINLPSAHKEPTDVPTLVPSLTPSPTPSPTAVVVPTDTLVPTNTPVPPPPRQEAIPVALPTATPVEPTPVPAPSFPFAVAEQGNREFQKTNYHLVTVYVAVVSEGNIPLGGYKVIGDHVPSGTHIESEPSDWNWSVANCLDCDYIKQGNLKFEPGPFVDGVWNIYLAEANGTPVSSVVPLSYSAQPEQWVWDFIIFRRKNG